MRLMTLLCCAALAAAACQSDAGKQPDGAAVAKTDATPSGLAAGAAVPAEGAAAAAPTATAPAAPGKQRTDGKADLPGTAIGKQQAPVDIRAAMTQASAHVTLTFHQAGHGVEVQATGVEGLSVQRDGMLATGRDVTEGQVLVFDVPIAPGAGLSMLAVHVRGRFSSGDRAAVRAFPIGKQTEAQRRKADVGTPTTVGGEATHGMSAEEEKK